MGTVIPNIPPQFFANDGTPAAGYKLFSYDAGTTVKRSTFTDQALSVANTNPIILDSTGRATIFLSPTSYKFVMAPPTDSDPPLSPIWTRDNVSSLAAFGINLDIPGTAGENLTAGQVVYLSAGDGGRTAGRWYLADADLAYASIDADKIGIATAAISTGVVGQIRTEGRVTGLSGLTIGTLYYISSTAGAMTATPPTNARAVGVADSTTSIILSDYINAIQDYVNLGASEVQVFGGLGAVNLVSNDDFLVWCDGDALAPTGWTLSGAGATIARAGTGLGDTTRKVGDFCAKLTRVGTDCSISQDILPTAAFTRADFLKGSYVVVGAWVKTNVANTSRVSVNDGVANSPSAFHTGSGNWEFLPTVKLIDASATKLTVIGHTITTNATTYFSGYTAMVLPYTAALTFWTPCPVGYGFINWSFPGTVATGTTQRAMMFHRTAIVKEVTLFIQVAPTGQALIADINTWDGAANTSMFSTRPQIAAGAGAGSAVPDSTYARRCLQNFNSNAGGRISCDIDQVGSGVPGTQLEVQVRILQYLPPQEGFLAP